MDRKSLIGLAKQLVVGLVIGTSSRPVLLLLCARKRELRAERFHQGKEAWKKGQSASIESN